jgi:hypothetical protein
VLGIVGLRVDQEHAAAEALAHTGPEFTGFRTHLSDVKSDPETVQRLFNAMMAAKSKAGEATTASFDSFKVFVQKKTDQIRKDYGCHAVEYSVELENGQVKLKAKAKI